MMAANVADLRELARRRLPKVFFDYVDGGSFGEKTLRENVAAFEQWRLKPAVLRDVGTRDLTAEFLGRRHALPIMLAPVGFLGLFAPAGEVQAARAAAAAGVPMCLSTFSICSVEEVARGAKTPLSLQLYVLRDRGLVTDLLSRAKASGVETIFLTVDSSVSAIRERDTRNGFRIAKRVSAATAWDMVMHPRWLMGMASRGLPSLGNLGGAEQGKEGFMEQVSYLSGQVDPTLTWRDAAWLRSQWPGKLVFKGIGTPEDARLALEHGADAVVVSNHGGRQLDGAAPSLEVLPQVADAVGGRAEVLMDGGIRRGSDVLKAVASGASAVLIGRALAYGLAAGGEHGVRTALELLRAELDLSLALMGATRLDDVRGRSDQFLSPRHTPRSKGDLDD